MLFLVLFLRLTLAAKIFLVVEVVSGLVRSSLCYSLRFSVGIRVTSLLIFVYLN